jgi:hypothetical protein
LVTLHRRKDRKYCISLLIFFNFPFKKFGECVIIVKVGFPYISIIYIVRHVRSHSDEGRQLDGKPVEKRKEM